MRVLSTSRQQPAGSQPTVPLTGTQLCLKSASRADLLQIGAVPAFECGTGHISLWSLSTAPGENFQEKQYLSQ